MKIISTLSVTMNNIEKDRFETLSIEEMFSTLDAAFAELIEELTGAQRMNAGFEIIAAQQVSTIAEVVLGKRESDGEYVTWLCFCGNDYNWGHYFGPEQACEAMSDFLMRVKDNKEV